MTETIACIPNISEGRNKAALQELTIELQAIRGLHVRQVHSDPDHHRSVFTLIGCCTALQQAVHHLFRWAAANIRLTHHQGVHPRLGAVDVVPFVPLKGISQPRCLQFVQTLAAEVAQTYQLPIYLYEKSTLQPGRSNLADIRRGQFEGLSVKMQHPEWRPDFGPPQPHPLLGATVIGMRDILIAFNAWLATLDVSIAKQIARSIRERDGGLPGVKALGLYLPQANQTQVSLNIVDWMQVSLDTLLTQLETQALAHHTAITAYELVGLAPREWLLDWALAKLKLSRQQVLDWP